MGKNRISEQCLLSFICFVSIYLSNFGICFNVDTIDPKTWKGVPGSYFGFSFDFYNYQDTLSVMVGAPKFQTNDVTKQSYFNCKLTEKSCTKKNYELQVKNIAQVRELMGNNTIWFGVSMSTDYATKNALIVCAHLYTYMLVDRQMMEGFCQLVNDGQKGQSFGNCAGCQGSLNCQICQTGSSLYFKDNDTILVGAATYLSYNGIGFHAKLGSAESKDLTHNDPNITLAGYSVAAGHILNKSPTDIVGAPRFMMKGAVLLYDDGSILPRKIIPGEQYFSGFGMDVGTGDFDNNGYEDLVVGAPFYYEKGYSGAVYVYYNGPGEEGLSDSPQTLKGTKSSNFVDVRFGFAIACGGDLNQDGFDDLVVGAPFEDSGAIYIFHGSTSLLSLSQKVTVRDFVPISSMKLFGYAISKKFVDTDDNGYPDFLVGSYQSDSVVLLRTRPVVNIHLSAETSPKIIDPKNPLCTNSTNPKDRCFAVSFKYKYTWILENKRSNKDKLNVLLTASIDNALASRAKFHTEGYNKSWKLAVDTSDTNFSTYVYLTENNRDWLSPITLTYTYELVLPETNNRNGNDFGPLGSLEKHPVLNAKNPKTGFVEVHFLKECGDDDKCDSDLNLKLESPSFNKISGQFEFKFSEELKLDVVVTNHGEDAHQAFLYVNLTKGLTFRGKDVTAASAMISCEYIEHASLLQCGVGNPLASHDVVHLRIRLSAKNLQTSLTHLNIEAFVNTTSNFDPSKTMANITFEKITESDLALISQSDPKSFFYGVEPKVEIKFLEQIGPEVEFIFEVKNVGNVSFPGSNVLISWPHLLLGDKFLFYIINEPEVLDKRGSCHYPSHIVDTLKLNPDRTKLVDKSDEQLYDKSSALPECQAVHNIQPFCEIINCQINSLEPSESSVIKIRTRFWNSTFHELFGSHEKIEVSIHSRLADSSVNQVNFTNDASTLTVELMKAELKEKVSWWIYAVAGAAGFLMLCLMVLCLWKCGFFKRKKYEHLVTVTKKEEFEDDSKKAPSSLTS